MISQPAPPIRRPTTATPQPVVLTIPADKDYVVLVRSAVGHLGARAGLSMEEMGDLRLAVNEACAVLLLPEEINADGATVECHFEAVDGAVLVTVAADAEPTAAPKTSRFGWSLMASLVDDVRWSNDGGRVRVSMTKRPAVWER